jgi:plasmid stabilization system protein ParE
MVLRWTRAALSGLERLHAYLAPANPGAAPNAVRMLVAAPDRLLVSPRIGERLERFAPHEVRRLLVGRYELRYEIRGGDIFVLRIWRTREDR